MTRLTAVFGYLWAFLMVPLVLAAFLGMPVWSHALVAATGLKVSPRFSGGDVVHEIDHGTYRTRIHRPVFDGLLGERSLGFVQIDWTSDGALPHRIDEEIDLGDRGACIHVGLDTAAHSAEVTGLAEPVLGLAGVYGLHHGVAVRIKLRNQEWGRMPR